MKRFVTILIGLLALPVLLFGAAFAVAQTQIAKDQISGIVEDNLSGPGQAAEVTGLEGVLPFDVRIGRVRLSDDEGAWLEVDEARVKTSPTDLLAGRIVVEEVGIERVALNRLPPPGPPATPEPEPESDGGFALPELPLLPESLPYFRADNIHVDEIALGEPILGETATFQLNGNAATNDDGTAVDAELTLARIDEPTAALALNAGADLTAQTISINLSGSETGGLTALLSGQEQAGDLSLSLNGSGPLDDFNATLAAGADNLASLNADLGFGIGAIPKLVLKADVATADGLLPPELTAFIGQDIAINIDAQERESGVFAVQSLDLQAGEISMRGGGEADINTNQIGIDLAIDIADIAKASDLAGTPLGGTATLTAAVTGALDQPDLTVDVALRELLADQFGIADATLQAKAKPSGSLEAGYPGVAATLNATLNGLTQNGDAILPGTPVTLDVDASAPTEGSIELKTFTLSAGKLIANVVAELDAQTLAGTANADVAIADIAALLQSLGPLAPPDLAVSGATNLKLDANIGEQAEQIDAILALTTDQLQGLPGGADAVTGPAPSLTADLGYQSGGLVAVNDLALIADALSIGGDVTFDQASQGLGGALTLNVPSLAALNELAGQELAGTVDVALNLAGSAIEPDVDASVLVTGLEAAGQAFDEISLDAKAAGALDAIKGNLALNTIKKGESLGLQTNVGREGTVITLEELILDGPTTRIAGNLALNTETQLANGSLKGGIEDLARLAPWIGQTIEGAVQLDTEFSGETGQNIQAAIDASGINGAFGTVDQANITADIQDLLGRFGVDLAANVKGFTQPAPAPGQNGLRVDDALVNLNGALNDLRLKAEVTGDQNGPLTAVLEARAALDGTLQTVGPQSLRSLYLDKLDAEMQGQTFELQAPAAITLDDGVLNLDQLDLKIGQGSIRGKASLDNDRVNAGFDLAGFDLGTVESLGGPKLAGAVDGRIDLTGTLQRPGIVTDLTISQMAITDADHALQFADIKSLINVGDGAATADVTISGLGEQPMRLKADVPLRLSFSPIVTAADLDALKATLDGRADLAKLAAFATVDGQRLAGTMTAALDVSGPISQPKMVGSLRIVDGLVEDSITGALLQDLQVLIDAKGDVVEITEFQANDGNNGELNVDGQISLVQADANPFDISLVTKDLHLLRNDLGNGWFNIDLTAAGSLEAAAVTGVIDAQEIDLQIPSRFAGSVDSIEVKEVNRPGAVAEEEAAAAPPIDLALDIAINVPARLFVRGRGLDSEWGGNLTVKGTAAEPQLAGIISFRRGFLDLLDRRFSIDQGTIDFDGAVPPDPSLLFQAKAEGETLDAIVTVFGNASAPEFELSSDPARPQDEVLAQLLFGRSVNEITPTQGIKLAAAANKLQGGGGLDPLGSLRDSVGLDTLDVGGESVDQASARAGKYLTDNVYFEVERGIAANSGKARIEVELSDNVSANTEFTEDSQTGVGLDWSYDY